MTEGEKRCSTCGVTKPLADFHKDPSLPDGHIYLCRPCKNQRARENPQKRDKRERAEAQRRYEQRHPERHSAKAKRHRERQPEKIRARTQLRHAVKSGQVAKPDACEKCGAKAALEGHHDDHAKPLEVRWLCAPCHLAEHGKEAHLVSA